MELEAARDLYVDLYDSAPTGYLTLNPKGMILEVNLPACTLLGMNRKLLIGKPAIRYVAAKDQATVLRHIRELFNTGTRQTSEVNLVRQDGVVVQLESVAIHDEAGLTHMMRTTLLDITERTRATAALQKWRQGLERQRHLETREQIGHDLHDRILQSLYAIGLNLEAGKLDLSGAPDKAEALRARSIGELNSVMQEVEPSLRRLSQRRCRTPLCWLLICLDRFAPWPIQWPGSVLGRFVCLSTKP